MSPPSDPKQPATPQRPVPRKDEEDFPGGRKLAPDDVAEGAPKESAEDPDSPQGGNTGSGPD